MHIAIEDMLSNYQCNSQQDYINAIKEIFQEIALLGLWRAKFFEHAAFYGGTALRILYNLDRFSEDMDFSLLKQDKDFNLAKYNNAIKDELQAFGFEVEVSRRKKNKESAIESAFIKANTIQQLISISAPPIIQKHLHKMNTIKIKMEVDTIPPGKFTTEVTPLLSPIPFTVKTYIRPDLFAGKMHAILCRAWKQRIKGRDWYDLIWYIRQKTPLNLIHLEERLRQSGHINTKLSPETFTELLFEKIQHTNFEHAKSDVIDFINDGNSLDVWSADFFNSLVEKITFI